jgi:multidrug efflux pump subunit AcrA (membrane-fusion protein)
MPNQSTDINTDKNIDQSPDQSTGQSTGQTHYSPEVQEILGSIPSWIIRWGIALLFVILSSFVLLSYFISFPLSVDLPITIEQSFSQTKVISPKEAYIYKILKQEKSIVNKSDHLAVLQDSNIYNQIRKIEQSIIQHSGNQIIELESLPGIETELYNAVVDYNTSLIKSSNNQLEIRKLTAQIDVEQKNFDNLKRQLELLNSDMQLAKESFSNDSILYHNTSGAISKGEYDNIKMSYSQKQSSYLSFISAYNSASLNLQQLKNQKKLETQKEKINIQLTRNELQSKRARVLQLINSWYRNNVLIANSSGILYSLKRIEALTRVEKSEELYLVKGNENSDESRAIAYLAPSDYQKIKEKDADSLMVNLTFQGNSQQFTNSIKSRISYLSEYPSEKGYYVEFEIKSRENSIEKNHNQNRNQSKNNIELSPQMKGTAQIILEDSRLINKFIDPIIESLKINTFN